jgi:hypothetical protein
LALTVAAPWGNSDFSYVAPPNLGSHNSNGGLIGGTVGFNYQTGS